MVPCRSDTHADASASDSACSNRDAVGEMTRKQNGRPVVDRSASSAPGLTHESVRSTAGTASSAGSNLRPGAFGSGAAPCLTNDHAAPNPVPIPRATDPAAPTSPPRRSASARARRCVSSASASSAANVSSSISISDAARECPRDDSPAVTPTVRADTPRTLVDPLPPVPAPPRTLVDPLLLLVFAPPRRPYTINRPTPSRTKYRRVQPPNFPGFRSLSQPFRIAPTPRRPLASSASRPLANDARMEASADRPEDDARFDAVEVAVVVADVVADVVAHSARSSPPRAVPAASPRSSATSTPSPVPSMPRVVWAGGAGGSTPKGSSERPSNASWRVLADCSIRISACARLAISYSSIAARSRSTPRNAAPASSKNFCSARAVSRVDSRSTNRRLPSSAICARVNLARDASRDSFAAARSFAACACAAGREADWERYCARARSHAVRSATHRSRAAETAPRSSSTNAWTFRTSLSVTRRPRDSRSIPTARRASAMG